MLYEDRIEKYLLQRFAHSENSDWFSIILVIIYEVSIVALNRNTIILFFVSFHGP